MKLLLFSDLHQSKHHCEMLIEMSTASDVVIGAGDFGSLRHGIKETIDILKVIDKPTFLVPGNSESYEELIEASTDWSTAQVLHGNGINLNNIHFYGIGGAVPVTPFGSWSYDFTEEQAADLLKDCPEGAVLISHSPPKGLLDKSSSGKSLGSTAVKEVIDMKKPRLVVCGHIHESSGNLLHYNDSVIINAGPEGMYFEISSD